MTTRTDVYMENRGTDEVPFGYVYAGDGRIGYVADEKHIHVFISNWGVPLDRDQRAMALRLREAFPERDIVSEPVRGCEYVEEAAR